MASIDSVKLPDGTEYNINEKLASFTNANLVEVDANGNLKDSGIAKSTIGNKQNKTLDTAVESQTTVEGALGALSSNKQPKTMSATVESQTTVEGALGALSSNKQPKTMSASVESQSTVEGALGALSSNKQPKTLATPITVDGVTETTTEGALGAINTLAASNKTALASKQNSSITPITIEGTSRSTVETALAGLNTYADDLDDAIDAITNVHSAKNLADLTMNTLTFHGITYTCNADKTVSVSGTNSLAGTLVVEACKNIKVPETRSYILSGGVSASVRIALYDETATEYKGQSVGDEVTIALDASHVYSINIIIDEGITASGTIKPMLRDSRIPDATYEPFAKTNLALTTDKAERTDLSDIIINGTTNNTGSTIDIGKYFYLNGEYCVALASIANGATFTLNTNYKKTNVGEELSKPKHTLTNVGKVCPAYAYNNTVFIKIPTPTKMEGSITVTVNEAGYLVGGAGTTILLSGATPSAVAYDDGVIVTLLGLTVATGCYVTDSSISLTLTS